MTNKTIKVLDGELNKLKDEFDNLKEKCDELSWKYECLEKKCCENALGKNFECETCSERFATINYLKKHRKIHNLNSGPFQCEHCDKLFNKEWKH